MNIVLVGKAASVHKKSRLKSLFETLRNRLEKERRRNDRFKTQLDELVEIHRRHTQASDLAQIGALKALTLKLITFASRKSLSNWHRDELLDWLSELVDRIECLGSSELHKVLQAEVLISFHHKGW
jgi:hypothetical protein